MKILASLAVTLLATVVLSSCKKEDGANAEDIAKANEFKTFVLSKQFQIKEYYSDKPIDYDENDDEVKLETDLWPYVSPWIKDDFNIFDVSSGKVTIVQNAVKIPGDDSEQIVRDISIGADKNGPYFNFVNYKYEPLRYRIIEFSGDHFLVSADWHSGAKVFTKFVTVQ